jgi:hypothetical protein
MPCTALKTVSEVALASFMDQCQVAGCQDQDGCRTVLAEKFLGGGKKIIKKAGYARWHCDS